MCFNFCISLFFFLFFVGLLDLRLFAIEIFVFWYLNFFFFGLFIQDWQYVYGSGRFVGLSVLA